MRQLHKAGKHEHIGAGRRPRYEFGREKSIHGRVTNGKGDKSAGTKETCSGDDHCGEHRSTRPRLTHFIIWK